MYVETPAGRPAALTRSMKPRRHGGELVDPGRLPNAFGFECGTNWSLFGIGPPTFGCLTSVTQTPYAAGAANSFAGSARHDDPKRLLPVREQAWRRSSGRLEIRRPRSRRRWSDRRSRPGPGLARTRTRPAPRSR